MRCKLKFFSAFIRSILRFELVLQTLNWRRVTSNTLVENIEAFDANDDDFPCYAERMEQYMLANNITDEKRKTAVFLTLVVSIC